MEWFRVARNVGSCSRARCERRIGEVPPLNYVSGFREPRQRVIAGCNRSPCRYIACAIFRCGGMAEWLKAHAWKACIRETVSWVRIPLPPWPPLPSLSIHVCPSSTNPRNRLTFPLHTSPTVRHSRTLTRVLGRGFRRRKLASAIAKGETFHGIAKIEGVGRVALTARTTPGRRRTLFASHIG